MHFIGANQILGLILFVFFCFVPDVFLLGTCWERYMFFGYLLLVDVPNSLHIPDKLEFLALS